MDYKKLKIIDFTDSIKIANEPVVKVNISHDDILRQLKNEEWRQQSQIMNAGESMIQISENPLSGNELEALEQPQTGSIVIPDEVYKNAVVESLFVPADKKPESNTHLQPVSQGQESSYAIMQITKHYDEFGEEFINKGTTPEKTETVTPDVDLQKNIYLTEQQADIYVYEKLAIRDESESILQIKEKNGIIDDSVSDLENKNGIVSNRDANSYVIYQDETELEYDMDVRMEYDVKGDRRSRRESMNYETRRTDEKNSSSERKKKMKSDKKRKSLIEKYKKMQEIAELFQNGQGQNMESGIGKLLKSRFSRAVSTALSTVGKGIMSIVMACAPMLLLLAGMMLIICVLTSSIYSLFLPLDLSVNAQESSVSALLTEHYNVFENNIETKKEEYKKKAVTDVTQMTGTTQPSETIQPTTATQITETKELEITYHNEDGNMSRSNLPDVLIAYAVLVKEDDLESERAEGVEIDEEYNLPYVIADTKGEIALLKQIFEEMNYFEETESGKMEVYNLSLGEWKSGKNLSVEQKNNLAELQEFLEDEEYEVGSAVMPDGFNLNHDTGTGVRAAEWALKRVGCAYDQSRREQERVFDCSSLVCRAYVAADKNLADILHPDGWSITAAELGRYCESSGKTVSRANLQIGDIICYSGSSNERYKNITHVEMYIGKIDGIEKTVEAKGTRWGVVISDFDTTNAVVFGRPY